MSESIAMDEAATRTLATMKEAGERMPDSVIAITPRIRAPRGFSSWRAKPAWTDRT